MWSSVWNIALHCILRCVTELDQIHRASEVSRCSSWLGKYFNEHRRDSAVLTGNFKEKEKSISSFYLLSLFFHLLPQVISIKEKKWWLIQTHFFAIVIKNKRYSKPFCVKKKKKRPITDINSCKNNMLCFRIKFFWAGAFKH